jgi:hypothetical protein
MTDNSSMPINTAAVSWQDSGGLHIRVYSTDGYNVIERCTDTGGTGWTAGSLNVPGSDVSATVWQDSGGVHIRVYATFEDGTTEWCFDPGSTSWTQGAYSV